MHHSKCKLWVACAVLAVCCHELCKALQYCHPAALVQLWCSHNLLTSCRDPATGAKSPGLGRRIALDTARGLHFLHSRKIVHFDLKSANILLSRDFTAKIADVGLAKIMQQQFLSTLYCIGTFAWAAPEVRQSAVVYMHQDEVCCIAETCLLWECYLSLSVLTLLLRATVSMLRHTSIGLQHHACSFSSPHVPIICSSNVREHCAAALHLANCKECSLARDMLTMTKVPCCRCFWASLVALRRWTCTAMVLCSGSCALASLQQDGSSDL